MSTKFVLILMVAGFVSLASCNSKTNSSDDENGDKVEKNDDISKAASEYCKCANNALGEINPKIRKVLIKSSKTDDPETSITEEMGKIEDEEERTRLGEEFQQTTNSDEVENCAKKIGKKYDLDVDDKKVQRKVLSQVEDDEDCDLIAAFLRISIKTKTEKKPREEVEE